ncbi:hypothetical protein F5148DRAFT_1277260 [Russula earlei]|uniref:Uncharacterized protein n=1 Tax=Russula earlei TaxID=71964 RepID=A0ACC0U1E2_9AGAM|nr:hypothetical protein F5148DRAFT_1277260 [Russula earlei]
MGSTYSLQEQPQTLSVTDPKVVSHNVLVDGAEHVVSYGGTSQYNRGGTGAAACGLAALNFARIIFSIEHDGLQDQALLQTVLARECAEETTAICALWSGHFHLEVEDIYHLPLFEKTLRLERTAYGPPGVSEFKALLMELNNLESSAAVVITRHPEIVACLKLRLRTRNVFIVFDSHPRPSYPDGAGMTISPSIERTARRLTELFPTVDLPDSSVKWQAQLLSNYTGHVFVPRGVEIPTPALWQAVLESSVAQLTMQAEIADLRSQNEILRNEQQRLKSEIRDAEVRNRHQERHIQPPEPSTSSHKPSSPSKASTSTTRPFFSTSSFTSSTSGRVHGRIDDPPTPPLDRDDDLLYATHLQHEYDDLLYAMGLQHEHNDEDYALSAQRIELERSPQRLFLCGICMEEMPEDFIARLDSCGHPFCRECLRGHVTARLDERRLPILCPTCAADKGKGKGPASKVSQTLALDLGLTNEQYSTWVDMEMAAFSVNISCRKCKRSMFVARDDHEEADIIACPLPDCNHAWCKQCQQSINLKGSKHSCDGSSELDHLMKQQGWKYCPTCKTPIQKESGCNHMSCMTPACNTHFCYVCGGLIVRSPVGHDIRDAISSHYGQNCGVD